MGKLAVQVQHYTASVGAYLDAIQPHVVKWLECPITEMEKVKARGGINIVRIPTMTALNVQDTSAQISAHAITYGSLVDYYELINEPDVSTYAAWLALRDYTLSCLYQLSPKRKLIVGNFSEGTIPLRADWWTAWETTLQHTNETGGGLGDHEYGAPTMRACAPWHVLRYRSAFDVLPASVKGVEWWLTEVGIDGGVTGGQHQGYQDFGGDDVFIPDLRWYESELDLDNGGARPNVKAAMIFLLGHYDPWATFDVLSSSAIRDFLAALAVIQPPSKEHDMAEFTVGSGVKTEMDKRGDAPLTDEHYVGQVFSITQGSKGVYIYFPQSNRVTFLPAQ